MLKSDRIGAAEDIDEFKGKTEEEIKEIIASRESKANAQILEMVGDIPDADARPPENVLFVCKLNPVTTDEDLEIIFSRFGPIVSCEVIRDQKTGDSLQYAFIEFENEEDCTKAYFKMDNVLIDDRRIHVDFSQSLAKVKGIHRRKLSEDGKEGGGGDGLVAKKRENKGGEYEMVFDDGELPPKAAALDAGKRKEQKYKEGHQKDREGHQKDREGHQKDREGHQKDREGHQKDREGHQKDSRRDRAGEDRERGHPRDRPHGGDSGRDKGSRETRDRASRHISEDRDHGRTREDSHRHHGGKDNTHGRERQRDARRSRSRSRSRGRNERR